MRGMDIDPKLLWVVGIVVAVIVVVTLGGSDLLDNALRILVRVLLRSFLREIF